MASILYITEGTTGWAIAKKIDANKFLNFCFKEFQLTIERTFGQDFLNEAARAFLKLLGIKDAMYSSVSLSLSMAELREYLEREVMQVFDGI